MRNWLLVVLGATAFAGSPLGGGSPSVTTSALVNNAVTYAKMQDVSADDRLIGFDGTAPGDPEEIAIGTGLAMSGNTLSVTATGSLITQAAYGSCSPTNNGDMCFATDAPLRMFRTGGANTTWLQGAPTLPGALTPPTTSTFGTTFGSATLSGNPLIVSGTQTNTSTLRGAYTTVGFPSPPYHMDFVFEGPRVLPAGFGGGCGFVVTDGTKFSACYVDASSGSPYLQLENWTNNTTYSSTDESLGSSRLLTGSVYALQWTDDGTNVSCRFFDPDTSSVGKRFTSTVIARTAFLTPTGWGVMLEEAGSSITFSYPSPVCRFLHASIGAGTTGWP